MIEFVVALSNLHAANCGKSIILTQKHLLIKVLVCRLLYIAKKQFSMTSAPMLLVVGMLNYVSAHIKAQAYSFKCEKLKSILARLGKSEVRRGTITQS